jgi:hypothetical protein
MLSLSMRTAADFAVIFPLNAGKRFRGAPDGGRASAKEPYGKSESISCIAMEILTRDPVLQHVNGPA